MTTTPRSRTALLAAGVLAMAVVAVWVYRPDATPAPQAGQTEAKPAGMRATKSGAHSESIARTLVAPPIDGFASGVVRDGRTGLPLAGAWVQARGRGWTDDFWDEAGGALEARSDAAGRYRIDGLPAVPHTIVAMAGGYVTSHKFASGARDLDFYLLPGVAIQGVVRDMAGQPVADARVRAEAEVAVQPAAVRPQRTDAAGRFEFVGLEPGRFRLVVRHPDFAPGVLEGVWVGSEGSDPAVVTLRHAVPIVGRLVDAAGRPLPAGSIDVHHLAGKHVPASLATALRFPVDVDGRFRLAAVAPGKHTLRMIAPSHMAREVDVDVAAELVEVDIGDVRMEAGLGVAGVVYDAAGLPFADVEIRATGVRPLEDTVKTRSDPDGRFSLEGLSPGGYRIHAEAPGFGLASMEVTTPHQLALDIVLQPLAKVVGRVVDGAGRPLQSYRVSLWPQSLPGRPFFKDVESGDGRFLLDAVDVGSYELEVLAAGQGRTDTETVALIGGDTLDVGRLLLQPGARMRGRVLDSAGAPVRGARIVVAPIDDRPRPEMGLPPMDAPSSPPASSDAWRWRWRATTSDSDGRFVVDGAVAEVVNLTVSHPLYAEGGLTDVKLESAPAPMEITVTLSHGGRIAGSVELPQGQPLPTGYVQYLSAEQTAAGAQTNLAPPTPVATDGSFEIDRISPGPGRVVLLLQGEDHYRAIQAHDVVVRENATTVAEFVMPVGLGGAH